jgi:hypothetical protein
MNQNKQDVEQRLKSLEKVTTELANNLEIAHGVRTCKVCGHTPEVMYKEVEKLVLKTRQEAVEEGRKKEQTLLLNKLSAYCGNLSKDADKMSGTDILVLIEFQLERMARKYFGELKALSLKKKEE